MVSESESVEMESVDGDVESISPRMRDGGGSVAGDSEQWIMMGRTFPRSEVKFFAQVIILYIVIFTCLANLSFGNGKLNTLWISVMATSIGSLMPSPHISRRSEVREAATTTRRE